MNIGFIFILYSSSFSKHLTTNPELVRSWQKRKKFIILFIYDGILDWRSFKTLGNFTPLPFDAKADDWNLAPFFVSIASKSTHDWETKR